MGICMALCKDLGQVPTGRELALLSPCFAPQGRETILQGTSQGGGTSARMQILAWDAWVLALTGVSQRHPVPAVSSCSRSAPAWERAGTGTDSFCQVRAVSLPPVPVLESHADVQLPLRRSLLLCISLVPLVDRLPNSQAQSQDLMPASSHESPWSYVCTPVRHSSPW